MIYETCDRFSNEAYKSLYSAEELLEKFVYDGFGDEAIEYAFGLHSNIKDEIR